MRFKLFYIMTLSLGLAVFVSCRSNSNFERTSLSDTLTDLGDVPEGGLIDTDGDGIADAIDVDGDGEPDVPFDPGTTIDPTDGGDSNDDGDPDDDNDGIPDTSDPDPTEPTLRDGGCIIFADTPLYNMSEDGTTNVSISGQNVMLSVSGNGTVHTFNLAGSPNLKRLIVNNSGNSNKIIVKNAELTIGICNEISGGSNAQVYESTSAALADLISGTGGNNSVDVLLPLSYGVRYSFSGNSHCMSVLAGTTVRFSDSNDNGHTFLDDGSTCL
jgi:hypothetical protein